MQRTRTLTLGACALVAALALAPGPTAAASTRAGRATGLAGSQEATAQVELDRSTPRAALLAFLEAARTGDHALAATHLDLASVPAAMRAEQGPLLARHLKIVLDQVAWIDLDALSAEESGDLDDGFAPELERVLQIPTRKGAVDVLLRRSRDERGALHWRISSSTVARIPALYEEFGFGRLGEFLPRQFFELHFLELQLWQWIGILVVLLAAHLLSWLATRALHAALAPALARTETKLDDHLLERTVGPVRLLAGLLLFSGGVLLLRLSVPVRETLGGLQQALAVVAFAWLFMRLVDVSSGVLRARLQSVGKLAALTVLPLGEKAVKVAVVGLALLVMLQNLGFNITGLLAGLGVGGLAVALAAQKTVENLFGGMSLILDQPVRVGDFCRYGDKIGTVEDIGLRSTRVRSLDRTVVTVPNSEFAYLQLENFARRDKIRFTTTLGLRYETGPDQMRWVLAEIRKLLLSHPKVDPDPGRVRFVGYGAYSLDLEIFAFVRSTDFNEYLGIQEDLLLRIMDIVNASGTGFAFPSSTTYLARDSGKDAELTRAAEERVRAWREQHELPFPDHTPEAKRAFQDALAFPPPGSVLAART